MGGRPHCPGGTASQLPHSHRPEEPAHGMEQTWRGGEKERERDREREGEEKEREREEREKERREREERDREGGRETVNA